MVDQGRSRSGPSEQIAPRRNLTIRRNEINAVFRHAQDWPASDELGASPAGRRVGLTDRTWLPTQGRR
jgi:hypothetical protein